MIVYFKSILSFVIIIESNVVYDKNALNICILHNWMSSNRGGKYVFHSPILDTRLYLKMLERKTQLIISYTLLYIYFNVSFEILLLLFSKYYNHGKNFLELKVKVNEYFLLRVRSMRMSKSKTLDDNDGTKRSQNTSLTITTIAQ